VLNKAVGQGRLAVIDMGNDRKVADVAVGGTGRIIGIQATDSHLYVPRPAVADDRDIDFRTRRDETDDVRQVCRGIDILAIERHDNVTRLDT
jgi:hypothetical protein